MLALHFLIDFVDLFCVMLFCFSILRGISIVGPRRMVFTKNSVKVALWWIAFVKEKVYHATWSYKDRSSVWPAHFVGWRTPRVTSPLLVMWPQTN